MKVKLLKKVRKRFSIEKVESVKNGTDESRYELIGSKLGFPFYVVIDNDSPHYVSNVKYFDIEYDVCYYKLVEMIYRAYVRRVKGDVKIESKKVWHKTRK